MGAPKLTRAQAGRLGGRKTAERGPAFFAAIGTKGGQVTAGVHDPWHFAAIGSKGGKTTAARRGRAWFRQISKI